MEVTDPPPPGQARHEAARALDAARAQIDHLQSLVERELLVPAPPGSLSSAAPAARSRETVAGEERWPVAVAVLVAITLQLLLADRFSFGPRWLLPALEGAVLVGIVAANPRRIDRRSQALRFASTLLVAFISAANAWSTYQLISTLVGGHSHLDSTSLLGNGASVYLTNVILFALWFWEGDRGGPVARAQRIEGYPAFLFPQMTQGGIAPDDWQPTFFDYLYTSYTNATAFSPTDTMPLTAWAKGLMLLQSAVSLATIALVVARAVNILK